MGVFMKTYRYKAMIKIYQYMFMFSFVLLIALFLTYLYQDSRAYIYLFIGFLCIPALIYLGNLERVSFIVDEDELRVITKNYTLNMKYKDMTSIDVIYHRVIVKRLKFTDRHGHHIELTYMIDHLSQLLLAISKHIKDHAIAINDKDEFNKFYQRAIYQDLQANHYKKILFYFLMYVAGHILFIIFCPNKEHTDVYLIYLAIYVAVSFLSYLIIFHQRLKKYLKAFDTSSNDIKQLNFDIHYMVWLLLTITHLILMLII